MVRRNPRRAKNETDSSKLKFIRDLLLWLGGWRNMLGSIGHAVRASVRDGGNHVQEAAIAA